MNVHGGILNLFIDNEISFIILTNIIIGGGTNIPKAFITLEEELIKVPKEN